MRVRVVCFLLFWLCYPVVRWFGWISNSYSVVGEIVRQFLLELLLFFVLSIAVILFPFQIQLVMIVCHSVLFHIYKVSLFSFFLPIENSSLNALLFADFGGLTDYNHLPFLLWLPIIVVVPSSNFIKLLVFSSHSLIVVFSPLILLTFLVCEVLLTLLERFDPGQQLVVKEIMGLNQKLLFRIENLLRLLLAAIRT